MEELLERVQYLLERMRDLARCAAEEDRTDEERASLQKEMLLLQGLLDHTVDEYEQGGNKDD